MKKIISLVCSLALILSVFAACGFPEAPAQLKKPTPVKDTFYYDGAEKTLELDNNFDPETMDVTGNKAKEPGEYICKVTIKEKEKYVWAGGGHVSIPWKIVVREPDVVVNPGETFEQNDGDLVLLTPGTYDNLEITAAITITSGGKAIELDNAVNVKSDGVEFADIKFTSDGSVNDGLVRIGENSQEIKNINFEGVTFTDGTDDGTGNGNGTNCGIFIPKSVSVEGLTLTNCKFTGLKTGIFTTDGPGTYLRDVTIRGDKPGDAVFENIAVAAFYCEEFENLTFDTLVFEDVYCGISICSTRTHSGDLKILNCVFNNIGLRENPNSYSDSSVWSNDGVAICVQNYNGTYAGKTYGGTVDNVIIDNVQITNHARGIYFNGFDGDYYEGRLTNPEDACVIKNIKISNVNISGFINDALPQTGYYKAFGDFVLEGYFGEFEFENCTFGVVNICYLEFIKLDGVMYETQGIDQTDIAEALLALNASTLKITEGIAVYDNALSDPPYYIPQP